MRFYLCLLCCLLLLTSLACFCLPQHEKVFGKGIRIMHNEPPTKKKNQLAQDVATKATSEAVIVSMPEDPPSEDGAISAVRPPQAARVWVTAPLRMLLMEWQLLGSSTDQLLGRARLGVHHLRLHSSCFTEVPPSTLIRPKRHAPHNPRLDHRGWRWCRIPTTFSCSSPGACFSASTTTTDVPLLSYSSPSPPLTSRRLLLLPPTHAAPRQSKIGPGPSSPTTRS
jgi:hypothetical protein